mmetsp:Transcript_51497/g.112108  ORF Transcript_51497/g.112108 Transcript_51497/m.112108 type:complete len:311 (-) Transcript_51497:2728-3660(-)
MKTARSDKKAAGRIASKCLRQRRALPSSEEFLVICAAHWRKRTSRRMQARPSSHVVQDVLQHRSHLDVLAGARGGGVRAAGGGSSLPLSDEVGVGLVLDVVEGGVEGGKVRVVDRRWARDNLGRAAVGVAQLVHEGLHFVRSELEIVVDHVEVRGLARSLHERGVWHHVEVVSARLRDVGIDHSARRHVLERRGRETASVLLLHDDVDERGQRRAEHLLARAEDLANLLLHGAHAAFFRRAELVVRDAVTEEEETLRRWPLLDILAQALLDRRLQVRQCLSARFLTIDDGVECRARLVERRDDGSIRWLL